MLRFRSILGALVAAVVVSGCAASPGPAPSAAPTAVPEPGTTQAAADGPSSSVTPGQPSTDTPSPAPTEPTSEPTEESGDGTTSLEEATLTPAGLGPILLGMSLAEAQAHGWSELNPECPTVWDASAELRSQGVSFKFLDDRLHEVLIYGDTPFLTAEGANPGMPMDQVTRLYGARLRTEGRETSDRQQSFPIVAEGDQELLFMVEPSGQVKSIIAHPYGAAVIAGC